MPKDTASDCASGLKEEFAVLSGPGPSKLSTERDVIEESRGRGCPTLDQTVSFQSLLRYSKEMCPRAHSIILPLQDSGGSSPSQGP